MINFLSISLNLCYGYSKDLFLREGFFEYPKTYKVSEYDQEIPQSHTADQPMAP